MQLTRADVVSMSRLILDQCVNEDLARIFRQITRGRCLSTGGADGDPESVFEFHPPAGYDGPLFQSPWLLPAATATASSPSTGQAVGFNLAGWLRTAAIAEIQALAASGWGDCQVADEAARYCAPACRQLGRLMESMRRRGESPSVRCEPAGVIAWMEKHRPDDLLMLRNLRAVTA